VREIDVMRLHIILGSLVALGFFASQTDVEARGGGFAGGGGHPGNFHSGGFGGNGHWGGSWAHNGNWAHNGGHGYYNRRYYYGPGFGFYTYPWWPWSWDYYGYYDYGPYYAYDGPYYGYSYGSYDPPSNNGGSSSQFNSTRAVQAALAWRGFYNGRIDGVMGPETRSAIEAFQKRQGLPVTGEIDSNLTKALQRNR
jgi:Putative peptidoglycan binding domain